MLFKNVLRLFPQTQLIKYVLYLYDGEHMDVQESPIIENSLLQDDNLLLGKCNVICSTIVIINGQIVLVCDIRNFVPKSGKLLH